MLPAREGQRVRPFIRAERSDIQRHLGRHGVPFALDPSNEDRRFQRARVRNEVLPLLAELSPGIVRHLNALADALGEGSELEDIRSAAARSEIELGRAHLEALSRARRLGLPGASVRLPGGKEARLDAVTGELLISGRLARR